MKTNLLLIVALLWPMNAVALPSIKDVPMLSAALGNDPKVANAANKTQKALLMQTGLDRSIDRAEKYVFGEVFKVAKVVEDNVANFINNNTPLNSKDVFFMAALGYAVVVDKQVTQKFNNPWFRNVQHTVTISERTSYVSVRIPF